jgi:hypothetical protein
MTPQSQQFILDLLIRQWEEMIVEMEKHSDHNSEQWSKMVQKAARLYTALEEFRKSVKAEEVTQ